MRSILFFDVRHNSRLHQSDEYAVGLGTSTAKVLVSEYPGRADLLHRLNIQLAKLCSTIIFTDTSSSEDLDALRISSEYCENKVRVDDLRNSPLVLKIVKVINEDYYHRPRSGVTRK